MFKKVIIVVVVVLILAAGSYLAWEEAERRRQPQVLRQAQLAYDAGDYIEMSTLLGEAISLDPDNIDALRLEAQLLDAVGRPSSVDAYEKLYRAQPADFEVLQNWLNATIRYDRAAEGLAAYTTLRSPAGSMLPFAMTMEFSLLGANLAKAAGDDDVTLTYLLEAYERAPDDPLRALELSQLQVKLLPPEELELTGNRLSALLDNSSLRSAAAAAMVELYRKRADTEGLLEMANTLWEFGALDLNARLLALDALYEVGDRAAYEEKLAILITEQQRRSIAMATILKWLLDRDEYETVMEVAAANTDQQHFQRPPIAPYVAEAMIETDNLEALREYTERVEWTGAEGFGALITPLTETLSKEKAQRYPNPKFNRWLRSAELKEIKEIFILSERLNMVREQEWMLAELIERQPWEREAYDRLYALRENNKDTLGMYRLLSNARKNFPNDRDLLNDHAYLALVLDIDRRGAVLVSEDNFKHDPANPEYRATQALALCMLRTPAKALDLLYVLDELPPRAKVTQALAHRMLDEQEAYDDMLMELDPDVMLPAEWRMVIGTRQKTPDIEDNNKKIEPSDEDVIKWKPLTP